MQPLCLRLRAVETKVRVLTSYVIKGRTVTGVTKSGTPSAEPTLKYYLFCTALMGHTK